MVSVAPAATVVVPAPVSVPPGPQSSEPVTCAGPLVKTPLTYRCARFNAVWWKSAAPYTVRSRPTCCTVPLKSVRPPSICVGPLTAKLPPTVSLPSSTEPALLRLEPTVSVWLNSRRPVPAWPVNDPLLVPPPLLYSVPLCTSTTPLLANTTLPCTVIWPPPVATVNVPVFVNVPSPVGE